MAAFPRSDPDIKEHPCSALFHMITTAAMEMSAVISLLANATDKQLFHVLTMVMVPHLR